MGQILAHQGLVFRRLENLYPLKEAHLAAQHQLRVGTQLLGEIGLIEPHHPHVAALIAHAGLGRAPAADESFLGLPNCSDDGLLLAYLKLSDGFPLAVIDVAPGKEVEHVAHRLDAEAAELGSQLGA